jgi:NADH-quinone oxidoreductase subunit J
MELFIFSITAAVAIIAAIIVITQRNPMVSALALVVNLCCIAIFYLLLNAMFIAAIQVIIYAGAIMVLILFVIMLLNLPMREEKGRSAGTFQSFLVTVLGVLFLYAVGKALTRYPGDFGAGGIEKSFGWTESIGKMLFTKYFYPFEAISLLLIAAMVGAVILAKRRM